MTILVKCNSNRTKLPDWKPAFFAMLYIYLFSNSNYNRVCFGQSIFFRNLGLSKTRDEFFFGLKKKKHALSGFDISQNDMNENAHT